MSDHENKHEANMGIVNTKVESNDELNHLIDNRFSNNEYVDSAIGFIAKGESDMGPAGSKVLVVTVDCLPSAKKLAAILRDINKNFTSDEVDIIDLVARDEDAETKIVDLVQVIFKKEEVNTLDEPELLHEVKKRMKMI